MKILVVDDSHMAVDVTMKLLREAGHEVDGLSEPEKALDRLRRL